MNQSIWIVLGLAPLGFNDNGMMGMDGGPRLDRIETELVVHQHQQYNQRANHRLLFPAAAVLVPCVAPSRGFRHCGLGEEHAARFVLPLGLFVHMIIVILQCNFIDSN